MSATLESRLPVIAAELQAKLNVITQTGAEWVEAAAKQAAPDATPYGEGLVAAIHTEPDTDGTYVVAGDEEVFYGHLVENGTVKMAAQPFLVPALEAAHGPIAVAASRVLQSL